MNKIPTSIQIFREPVEVILKPSSDEQGSALVDDREVYVDPHQSMEDQLSTLFHECVHMCLGIGGVSFQLDEKQEEAIVRCLEHGLWPILQFRKPKA